MVVMPARRGRRRAARRGGRQALPVWGDFAHLAEVRALATQVGALAPRLDVLVNNAGLYTPRRAAAADGFELTMGVNHFAPFLLTHRLLPLLLRDAGARIVNVSSMTHDGAALAMDDLDLTRGWSAYGAYATSKLANVLFTRALAVRHASVTANALHPGVIGTKLLKSAFAMRGAAGRRCAHLGVSCHVSHAGHGHRRLFRRLPPTRRRSSRARCAAGGCLVGSVVPTPRAWL
jgi:NAD(P)-dependent dehydrogenase (short-subunit alcohol dehydrogenase family)